MRGRRAPGRCWDCRWYAWRRCRACERWVCKAHRHGAGRWFRCEQCPYETIAEIMRAEHQQLRAEYRAQQARLARRAFIRRGGVVVSLVRMRPV